MAKSKLFYKYLDAGDKSSAVVLDAGLDTCKEQTIYLYNYQRNEIIEYRRDIVEPKLRELTGEEAVMQKVLQNDYKKVRSGFKPRGAISLNIPKEARVAVASAPANEPDEMGLEVESEFEMEFDE